MANLIALLSMLCSFFRSVVRKNIPLHHKSISILLKISIDVITFLCPDSKLGTNYFFKFSRFLALFITFSMCSLQFILVVIYTPPKIIFCL